MNIKLHEMLKAGLAAMAIVAISACATMEGVGEDVEAAGEAVQEAAEG